MTTTRKERAAETEAALKAAAKRVFAERGWANTKITDITAAAGRAAGSFYNHFPSKEALLQALLADLLEAGDEAAAEPEHSMDFTDRAAIRFHVASFWRFYREHMPVMVALREAAQADPALRERLQELTREDGDHLQAHLATVRHLPGAPRFVVSAFTSLLEQFAWTWLANGGDGSGPPPSDEEAIELLTTILHSGIAGRG
ncbi:TetR/AcrR family transcriptional regulator [Pseudonocardia sp. CA-107938]|uniref:TetR/AcrR family transcriptional regulator n=1 Tax=Pseudonocardia sp. CA-107938 TaxID=3240021 RepID=UPI003D908BF4